MSQELQDALNNLIRQQVDAIMGPAKVDFANGLQVDMNAALDSVISDKGLQAESDVSKAIDAAVEIQDLSEYVLEQDLPCFDDYVTGEDLPDFDEFVTSDQAYDIAREAVEEADGAEPDLSAINDHLRGVAKGSDCGDGNPFRAAVVSVVAGLFGIKPDALPDCVDRIGACTRDGSQLGSLSSIIGQLGGSQGPIETLFKGGADATLAEGRWWRAVKIMRDVYKATTAAQHLSLDYEVELGDCPAKHGIAIAWTGGFTNPNQWCADIKSSREGVARMIGSALPNREPKLTRQWMRLASAKAASVLMIPVPCDNLGSPLSLGAAASQEASGQPVGALFVVPSLSMAQIGWGQPWPTAGGIQGMEWNHQGYRELESHVDRVEQQTGDVYSTAAAAAPTVIRLAKALNGLHIPGAYEPWGTDGLIDFNNERNALEAMMVLAYSIHPQEMAEWSGNHGGTAPSWAKKVSLHETAGGGMVAI